MDVNIKEIKGSWDKGYSLDKHIFSSSPAGYNSHGFLQFRTVRSVIGEVLFQLKYRLDFSPDEFCAQVNLLASQILKSLEVTFSLVDLVVPIPPSKKRDKQPVVEIAKEYARLKNIPCYENLLLKNSYTKPLKNVHNTKDRISTLTGVFSVIDVLPEGLHNILLIDDLVYTGVSLEAATAVLRSYNKIRNVFVLTITRKEQE
ncbi:hypothetical protein P0082_07260 [Candidatus Haliotispira prima]|uniref:ComF family protein n=1 Tax=Candidatus Haliotispira prima TaxID=3034016 RepID=A0ABY8MG17_9SPIO|nr:hypothetical protein P0082_07260 [Candidatus Haliotispira prima]